MKNKKEKQIRNDLMTYFYNIKDLQINLGSESSREIIVDKIMDIIKEENNG